MFCFAPNSSTSAKGEGGLSWVAFQGQTKKKKRRKEGGREGLGGEGKIEKDKARR